MPAGRRTYRFFEPEMDAQVMARRQLELDLRQALSDGALEVYYQPCLGLQDNKITGCEALLRWQHPVRGMVSPAEFIPIAEETGLINQIGEWVLTTACAAAAKWPEDIRLAVNVSPVQERHAGVESRRRAGRIGPLRKPAGTGDYRGGAHPR
jgi:EAL domain-containing protein (putative c-di-GMP-specific phosphodiesterase class I)